jgi:hypothetical protein
MNLKSSGRPRWLGSRGLSSVFRVAALSLVPQALLVGALAGQAAGSIAGKVLDSVTGEPITETEIRVRGATLVSATNQSGWFLIPAIQPGEHVLEVRRMGYHLATLSVDVSADEVLMLDLQLIPSPVTIPGATAVGRGVEAPGSGTTGGIEVVELDDNLSTSETAEALLRRVLGAQVFAGSGAPGAQSSIRLRGPTSITGNQEPLIVIDGIVGREGLAGVRAADIARLVVYRGAAAAAEYGSRGQAGVVEITTKRGGD